MTKKQLVKQWYERALSNLRLAKLGKISNEIYLEDLCFNAQQAAEKSLKALCVKLNVPLPKTHNIMYLLKLIQNAGIEIPKPIIDASALNEYAVESRYPGDYYPVNKEDYAEAIMIAEKTLRWVKDIISE